MTQPRKHQIALDETKQYHITDRCVRQAFLLDENDDAGQNSLQRKEWVIKRIKFLAQYFAIDINAYAIMSNHYHLILTVNRTKALQWTEVEVIKRWKNIYVGDNFLVQQYQDKQCSIAEQALAQGVIELWRTRLYDISWYMKNLNEYIAKRANKEDGCKGHFWQSRFRSQALLDNNALLACMMYVDLNPIRANIASDLPNSDFTSIQERINAYISAQQAVELNTSTYSPLPFQPPTLLPFEPTEHHNGIQFMLTDYFELIDWTARLIVPDKPGFIASNTPKLITLLNINEQQWINLIQNFQHNFAHFAGTKKHLHEHACKHGKKWHKCLCPHTGEILKPINVDHKDAS